MATAFTNNPDSSDLLRFPLNYSSYFLIRLAYGFFDPASALGCLGLFGILLGVQLRAPALFPWALLVLLTFALFNLVLMQTIFAWLERWLAQRRTREIMGVLFILLMLSFQLIGPMMERLDEEPRPELQSVTQIVAQVQAVLPPGLAADAIAQAIHSHFLVGFSSLFFSGTLTRGHWIRSSTSDCAPSFAARISAKPPPRPVVAQPQGLQVGWNLSGFSQPVAAVFEKEIRYLARSGPMLLTLIMPLFMLVVFRLGPMNPMQPVELSEPHARHGLPRRAAYALLVLTNLVFNSFGGDAAGMQFFYASPVHFRQIVLGKNLTHASILVANTALAWIAVSYFYGTPHLAVTIATVAGLLFAAPLNFAAGNLLSIYSPKKRDFATFGRQNVSQTTVLASFGLQIVIVGMGVAAFDRALYRTVDRHADLSGARSDPSRLRMILRLNRLALERENADGGVVPR